VLLIDVDNFKSINDALGHHAGDFVLCAVADRLRECIRDSDTAARLGGDEFAVLLEDCGENGAEQAAARIVDAFVAPFTIDGRGVSAGVSVGVSLDTGSPENLLRQADLAMYAAKAAGKDRYAAFVPAMQHAADRRRALESDLRRALGDGGLYLQYQPIIRLEDESVVGAEALLRWRHPERGLIPPAEFIPLAEEAGLIVAVGRWVLGEATRQGAAWRERWPWLGMSVNVSGLQVGHPEFIAHVTDALAGSGLRHRNLILELTESVLMHDVEATIARLWEAKELGVQIAADDFGTGYSSLQYLDRFPLDILKLPRTFVEGLGADGGGQTIARAVVELGHNLGLRVVGEGIEQPEQLAALRQMGCALGQGFHFARPLDPADFEARLERSDTRRVVASTAGARPAEQRV
jgi:diguanylate cyclase (GGDEF)-like protein